MHLAVCNGMQQAKLMQQQLQVVCCFWVAAHLAFTVAIAFAQVGWVLTVVST